MSPVEYEFDFDGPVEGRRDFTFLDLDSKQMRRKRAKTSRWNPAKPGTRFGEYEVTGTLGEGGMSLVLAGRHSKTREPVAIKLLHEELEDEPSVRSRFKREAMAVSRAEHENIIKVHVYGIVRNRPFMVLELLESSVADQLDEQRRAKKTLPIHRAVEVATMTLRGIRIAHEHELLHRDVKPANLLVDKSGRVKLADFGLVKLLGTGPQTMITAPGTVVGTPLYMAPEQCAGGLVSEASDLYSVGVTLFELLTNRLPFTGAKTPYTHYRMQLTNPAPRVLKLRPNLPNQLDAYVAKLLQFDAKDRYPTASAALEALEVAAPAARKAKVTVVAEGHRVFSGAIKRGEKLVMGRSPDADVTLNGKGLSRFHAQLQLTPRGLVLTDLESTNGTSVDGRKIAGPTTLPHRAEVGLGKHVRVMVRW